METILVNKLPTRTWNRLGVNETALLWDEAGAVDGGTEVLSADGRLELSADAPRCRSWMSTPSCAARSRPTVRRAAPWSCTVCFPAGATPTPTTG